MTPRPADRDAARRLVADQLRGDVGAARDTLNAALRDPQGRGLPGLWTALDELCVHAAAEPDALTRLRRLDPPPRDDATTLDPVADAEVACLDAALAGPGAADETAARYLRDADTTQQHRFTLHRARAAAALLRRGAAATAPLRP